MPKRDTTLQQEMIRQQNNERLRRQFAQKANVVGQWIERHLDAVASVGIQKGSLEVSVEPTVHRTQVGSVNAQGSRKPKNAITSIVPNIWSRKIQLQPF